AGTGSALLKQAFQNSTGTEHRDRTGADPIDACYDADGSAGRAAVNLQVSPSSGEGAPIWDPYKVNSLVLTPGAEPINGTVRWEPKHSLWNGGHLVAALILGPVYFSPSAFVLFL